MTYFRILFSRICLLFLLIMHGHTINSMEERGLKSLDVWSLVEKHPVFYGSVAAASALVAGALWYTSSKTTPKSPSAFHQNSSIDLQSSNSLLLSHTISSDFQPSSTVPVVNFEEQKHLFNKFSFIETHLRYGSFHKAACEGSVERLKDLLATDSSSAHEYGPDLLTPCMLAAGNGHLKAVQFLIENAGLKHPGEVDKNHMSVMAHAVRSGNLALVKLLVEHITTYHSSSYICTQFFKRPTPLHCAIQDKQYAIARYLIEQGASLESLNLEGQTPIHWAIIQKCDADFILLLVSSCSSLRVLNRYGYTILDCAHELGDINLENVLRAEGAKTAQELKVLAEQEVEECRYVQRLIKTHGSINAQPIPGYTLLDLARAYKSERTEQVLLAAGAQSINQGRV